MTNFKLLFLLFAVAFSPCTFADYLAYALSKKSKTPIALPENIDDIEPKYILNFKWGEYSGNTVRVGVLPVDNTSNTNSSTWTMNGVGGQQTFQFNNNTIPVNGISAIISSSLLNSGRFRVVERTNLNVAFNEQQLTNDGHSTKQTGAKSGKILGASYLIQAVITNYEPNVSSQNNAIGAVAGLLGGGVLGGLGIKKSKAAVGMNFRLIDPSTSEVVFSKQVNSTISSKGLTFGAAAGGYGGGIGGFMSSYSKTSIGQAIIATVNKGIFELAKQIGTKPVTGSIIKPSKDKIYINLSNKSVSVGEILNVNRLIEDLIDPETGISLGGEEEFIGEIEVIKALDKFSIAKAISGFGKIKAKDKIVSTRIPAPLKYGPIWNKKTRKAWKK